MNLAELPIDAVAVITSIPQSDDSTLKLLENGLVPNSKIMMAHKAPFNGPVAILLHGTKIALPFQLAQQIVVKTQAE